MYIYNSFIDKEFIYHAAAASKAHQSRLTLCNPIEGCPPGSSVHRILQARIPEWVAISFSTLYHTIHLFKVCDLRAFNVFMELDNLHHNQFSNIFDPPKRNTSLLAVTPHFPGTCLCHPYQQHAGTNCFLNL